MIRSISLFLVNIRLYWGCMQGRIRRKWKVRGTGYLEEDGVESSLLLNRIEEVLGEYDGIKDTNTPLRYRAQFMPFGIRLGDRMDDLVKELGRPNAVFSNCHKTRGLFVLRFKMIVGDLKCKLETGLYKSELIYYQLRIAPNTSQPLDAQELLSLLFGHVLPEEIVNYQQRRTFLCVKENQLITLEGNNFETVVVAVNADQAVVRELFKGNCSGKKSMCEPSVYRNVFGGDIEFDS